MIVPREGRWTAKPLRSRTRLYARLTTAVQAFVWIEALYVLVSHRGFETFPDWALYLQTLAFLGVYAYILVNEIRILRQTQADAARSERPPGLDEFPVEVAIKAKGGAIGNDRGVVYFGDGLLGFVGGRTSFLLAEADVERPKGTVLFEWDRPYLPLSLNLESAGASISVRPLIGYGRAYRRALRRFLREKAPSDAPRQWPPVVAWKQQTEAGRAEGLGATRHNTP